MRESFTTPDPSAVSPERPDDPQRRNRYDYVGNNPLATVDPDGCTWTLGYNYDSTITRTLDARGIWTEYEYDALGNLRKVEQGTWPRCFTYDSMGRLFKTKNLNGNEPSARRKGARLQLRQIRRQDEDDRYAGSPEIFRLRGLIIPRKYMYDALGRLT